MIRALLFIFLLQIFLLQTVAAQAPVTGPVHEFNEDVVYFTDSGHAEFTSRVPLHTFTGESDRLTGMIDPGNNIIDFYLDLNTLKTGIGRRDRDMYRTLNVSDHPFAEFSGTLETEFDFKSGDRHIAVASGDFTIHGVTREVRLEGFLQMQGDDLALEVEWTLLLDDYDIDPPGILFYRVNQEQEIRIEAVLKPHNRSELTNDH